MKAWTVRTKDYWGYGNLIVFAETRAKAIYAALSWTDTFDGCVWIDMSARRFPEYDQHYSGKMFVDWDNMDDRIRLVRDFDWHCGEAIECFCQECPANEWCEEYKSIYGQEDP